MSALLSSQAVQAVAFILFLVALPLVAFGAMEGLEPVWMLGLLLVIVAGILPPAARFLLPSSGDDDAPDEGRPDDPGAPIPPEGPVGPPTAAPGRDLGRARVQEQEERARELEPDDPTDR